MMCMKINLSVLELSKNFHTKRTDAETLKSWESHVVVLWWESGRIMASPVVDRLEIIQQNDATAVLKAKIYAKKCVIRNIC